MNYLKAKDTVAFFSAIIALVLAVLYVLLRAGFENSGDTSLAAIFAVLFLSWFILFLPVYSRRFTKGWSWLGCDAFVLLTALTILVLAGYYSSFSGLNIIFPFIIVGLVFFVRNLYNVFKQNSLISFFSSLFWAGIFAVWLAGVNWGTGGSNPLSWEGIFYGFGHIDLLFHTSLASMLKTYGVVSTGLDGIPTVGFHAGSNWLFSQFCSLLNMRTMIFYQLGFPVIFIPLLINALLLLVLDIRKYVLPNSEPDLVTDFRFWLFFIALQIGIWPVRYYSEMGAIARYGRFNSTSYVVALLFSLILGSLLFQYWQRQRVGSSLRDGILLVLIVPALIGFISFTKFPVGFLMVAFGFYLFIRLSLYKKLLFFACCAISLAVSLWVYYFTSSMHTLIATPGRAISLHLFDLVSAVPLSSRPFYPLFYFLLALFFVAFRLYKYRINTLGELFRSLSRNEIIDVEIVVGLCILGAIPGAIFYMPDGSAAAFSDLQEFAAILFLLVYWPLIWPVKAAGSLSKTHRLVNINTSMLFGLFVLLPFIITVGFNYFARIHRAIEVNMNYRIVIVFGDNHERSFSSYLKQAFRERDLNQLSLSLRPLFSGTAIRTGLANSKYGQFMNTMSELSRWPQKEKRRSMVFISSEDPLWNLLDRQRNSAPWYALKKQVSIPFIIPAITEMALLDGLPPFVKGRPPYQDYSYLHYASRVNSQSRRERRLDQLCGQVKAKGFSRLLLVNSGNGDLKVIECNSLERVNSNNGK